MIMIVPSSSASKPNNTAQSGYKGREMDAMKTKLEEDRKRKLALQERDLKTKTMELHVQEDKHSALLREITKLKGSQSSVSANSGAIVDLNSLERQNTARMAAKEGEIRVVGEEIVALGRAVESNKPNQSDNKTLIVQKEREAKQNLQIVDGIKDEIKRKNSDLIAAENKGREIQREITELKSQSKDTGNQTELEKQNIRKVSEAKAKIEKLKSEMLELGRDHNAKAKTAEETNNKISEKKKQAEDLQRLLQGKIDESKIVANRIAALDQEIEMIKDRVQALQR